MKRVADLYDDECAIVFQKLPRATKVQLLATLSDDVVVYQEARCYRDVLSLIVAFVDLPTYFRLKQCCRMFRDNLHTPASTRHIQHFLSAPADKLAPLELMRDGFEFYLRRLVHTLESRKCAIPYARDPMFLEPTGSFHELRYESIARFMVTVQQSPRARRWFVIDNVCKISYPHGLVCKTDGPVIPRGHIFDDNVLNCFTFDQHRTQFNVGVHLIYVQKMSKSERALSKEQAEAWKRSK